MAATSKSHPIPLSHVPAGYTVRVVSIMAGRGAARRLAEMGLTPGSIVRILKNDVGPILLYVRGITVAIGKGMAMKVLVEII
ncbi:MAG: ferrous iron transport protein A [Desulfurococcales archaeon ex4484_217_1]|nr:MAG: ferrous iron transport protein A [Desulfurococcales archaeon ex4484_217_1]